jgi:hypothetical protein
MILGAAFFDSSAKYIVEEALIPVNALVQKDGAAGYP